MANMNPVITIAAGVAVGLLATAAIAWLLMFLGRQWAHQRKRFLRYAKIGLMSIMLAFIAYSAGSYAYGALSSWREKQRYARQIEHARDWCRSSKSIIIDNFTKPSERRSDAFWDDPTSDPFYPLDIDKWHNGTLHNAITSPVLKPGSRLALCGYLGAVTQDEITDAQVAKQANQETFDSALRERCLTHSDPKPLECMRFRPKLEDLIRK